MAIVLLEGFDSAKVGFGISGTALSFPTGRSGGTCVRVTGGGGFSPYLTSTLPEPVATLCAGMAMGQMIGWGIGEATQQFLQFREGTTVHLALRYKVLDGQIEVINGDGTVLGTTPSSFARNSWHHYDLAATIDDTVGAVKLTMNGVVQIDLTGVDTRNGGTTGLISNVHTYSAQTSSSSAYSVDDLYITDGSGPAPYNGSLGDCRIATLRPNGNGATSDWIGSDANSVDNYLLVDDVAVTTDYVEGSAVGNRDLYTLTDLSIDAAGEVLAFQTEVYVAKTDAGVAPGTVLAVQRAASGTATTGLAMDAATQSVTYQWARGPIQTLDPDGAPLTVAGVNALQAGTEIGA